MMRMILIVGIAVGFSIGCKGDKESDKSGNEATASSTAKSLDDKKTICCEFKGVTGTSTEKLCVEQKGKVVTNVKPPKCQPE